MMPNSHIREYIECERRLYGLITDIYNEIGEKINEIIKLDIDFAD